MTLQTSKPETKAAAPVPAIAPEAFAAATAVPPQMVPWNKLFPSPLNPRKAHNAEADAELAEAILAQGLLENLVARPAMKGKAGEFEIIAGARRHHAIGLLIKRGAKGWTETLELPVKVRAASDRELLEIGTIENVQRESLTPIEEAHAFKALRDQDMTVVQIAASVGKNRRFVEQRLALIDRLHPEAQKALGDGRINVTQARVLTQAPHDRQTDVLKEIVTAGHGRLQTEDDIKRAVRGTLIPIGDVWFDPKLYTGKLEPHPDKPKVMCCMDIGLVERLQKEWLEGKKAQLKEKWHWVEVKNDYGQGLPYGYSKKPNAEKAGAVIIVSKSYQKAVPDIHIHEGVVDNDNPARGGRLPTSHSAPRSSGSAKKPAQQFNAQEFAAHVGQIKRRALQGAVAGSVETALRLLCLPLLDHDTLIAPFEVYGGDDKTLDAGVKDALAKWKKRTDAPTIEAAWNKLQKLNRSDLEKLLPLLVARVVETMDNPYGVDPGEHDDAVFIAEAARVDMLTAWNASGAELGAFLRVCGPDQLKLIAAELQHMGALAPVSPKITNADLRSAIAKAWTSPKAKGYRPIWLREFLTPADIKSEISKTSIKLQTIASSAKATPAAKKKAAKKGGK